MKGSKEVFAPAEIVVVGDGEMGVIGRVVSSAGFGQRGGVRGGLGVCAWVAGSIVKVRDWTGHEYESGDFFWCHVLERRNGLEREFAVGQAAT